MKASPFRVQKNCKELALTFAAAVTSCIRHIALFLRRKTETEASVVMIHDVGQRGEATIVIEATFAVGPQTVQRCSPVRMIGRAIRLKIINTDF